MSVHRYFIKILVLFSSILISCGVHYVELESTSKKIELKCYSILLPESGEWYKQTYSIPPPPETCTNDEIYIRYSEDAVFLVRFTSEPGDWNDKYNNQYLYDMTEKSLKWKQEKKRFSRNLSFKEFGVEDYNYTAPH